MIILLYLFCRRLKIHLYDFLEITTLSVTYVICLNNVEIVSLRVLAKLVKLLNLFTVMFGGLVNIKYTHTCNDFLIIVDDYTRAIWTYLFWIKTQVPKNLKHFCVYVHRQFDTSLKIVRIDNGNEFFNNDIKTYFQFNSVVHQHYCIETPQ